MINHDSANERRRRYKCCVICIQEQPVNSNKLGSLYMYRYVYMSGEGLGPRSFIPAFVKPSALFSEASQNDFCILRRYTYNALIQQNHQTRDRIHHDAYIVAPTSKQPTQPPSMPYYTRYTHDDIENISIWISILHFLCIFA